MLEVCLCKLVEALLDTCGLDVPRSIDWKILEKPKFTFGPSKPLCGISHYVAPSADTAGMNWRKLEGKMCEPHPIESCIEQLKQAGTSGIWKVHCTISFDHAYSCLPQEFAL